MTLSVAYPRMRLTPNFWLHEAAKSGAAARFNIDNAPPLELLPVLCHSAAGMERIRSALGDHPVIASSWYRSRTLNERVGGDSKSQHMLGEAVDFRVVGVSVVSAAQTLVSKRDEIGFDQLILEYPDSLAPWLHVSFAFDRAPRRAVLHIVERGQYRNGLGSWA